MTLDAQKVEEKLKGIMAKDIMSRFAITIKEGETVANLAHVMMRFKISGVLVLGKNGEPSGIITATDLFNLMKSVVKKIDEKKDCENYLEISINELMVKNLVTITEDTSLFEIIKIMFERNIHTLPVMVLAKREIIGVIGRRDILNAFYVGVGEGVK